jgi:nanoRNase/pAp phosphatase (c-di-AMP/oligoRNAs hydrolase)
MPSPKIVVLYHKDCLDGFGSAWAAYKKFGNKAKYIAVEHGLPIPDGLNNKTVYSIDFTYPEAETKVIAKKAKQLVLIDHHISVRDIVERQPESLFDNDHSGAVLAWLYFHPGVKVPRLLSYIQDIDLWRFRMPETKELISFLRNIHFDFKIWNGLANDFEDAKSRKEYMRQGRLLLKYDEKTIDETIAEGYETKFEGHKAFVVNSSVLDSEIGAAIVKRGYPVAIIWRVRDKLIHVSLRSSDKVDVSKLAFKHGGGGHHSSAGFELAMNKKLPW